MWSSCSTIALSLTHFQQHEWNVSCTMSISHKIIFEKLTPEKMVLQATPRHELVDKKPLFVLQAIPDELHKIGV